MGCPRDNEGVGSAFIVDARKVCGWLAALIALIATVRPLVPFLAKGMERPEAIWRCVWLGDTAPIADQLKIGYVLRGDWVEKLCRSKPSSRCRGGIGAFVALLECRWCRLA